MAVVKYAGEEAVGRIAQYVNRKLTVVSAMPSSPEIAEVVLYVGPVTEDYTMGGIYMFNGTSWVLISSAVEHILSGYYFENAFFEDEAHTIEMDAMSGYIYIDLPNDAIYLYNEELEKYILAGGEKYEAGYGITIDGKTILAKTFVGTKQEWNALVPADQSKYDTVCFTNDNGHSEEIEVAYVDELPTVNIQDTIYGLLSYHNESNIAAINFLDNESLFTKTILDEDSYVYTSSSYVQASTNGITYHDFVSLRYDGKDYYLTVDDGEEMRIALNETFYWRTIINKSYYAGCVADNTVNPISAGGASGGSVIMVTTTDASLIGTIVTASGSLFTNQAVFDSDGTAIIEGIKEIGEITIRIDNGELSRDYEMTLDSYNFYQLEVFIQFDYKLWCQKGGVDYTQYDSIDEVFEDEVAVRRLMLTHPSADYLIECVNNDSTEITPFLDNDTAMKWIGLCDYVCDGLTNVSKNMLPYPYAEASGTVNNGVTFTVGNDGSVTANGTATGGTAIFYLAYRSSSGITLNPNTRYAISGTPGGGSWDTYAMFFFNTKDGEYHYICSETGNGREFSLTAEELSEQYYGMGIRIAEGTVVSNIKFYPMLRVSNSSSDYEIYHLIERMLVDSSYYGRYLKDQVPIMISATTPYGTVSASSYYSSSTYGTFYPYLVFDGVLQTDGNHRWIANSTTTGWLDYQYNYPVCVKRVSITTEYYTSGVRVKDFKIQASKDGTTYVDLYTGVMPNRSSAGFTTADVSFENNEYYMNYRVYVINTYDGSACIDELQFYGRGPSISVPIFSSATAPYGQFISSSEPAMNLAYKWHVFNGITSPNGVETLWATADGYKENVWVGYVFPSPIRLKAVEYWTYNTTFCFKEFIIQASNDGTTWVDLFSGLENSPTYGLQRLKTIDSLIPYKMYRFYIVNNCGSNYTGLPEVNFFGVDYSEKEFESGTSKRWLYDHGVELTTIVPNVGGSYSGYTTATPTKDVEDNYLRFYNTGAKQMSIFRTTDKIDVTDYSEMFFRQTYPNNDGDGGEISATAYATWSAHTGLAYSTLSHPNKNYARAVHLSSISEEAYLGSIFWNDAKGAGISIAEWWIE